MDSKRNAEFPLDRPSNQAPRLEQAPSRLTQVFFLPTVANDTENYETTDQNKLFEDLFLNPKVSKSETTLSNFGTNDFIKSGFAVCSINLKRINLFPIDSRVPLPKSLRNHGVLPYYDTGIETADEFTDIFLFPENICLRVLSDKSQWVRFAEHSWGTFCPFHRGFRTPSHDPRDGIFVTRADDVITFCSTSKPAYPQHFVTRSFSANSLPPGTNPRYARETKFLGKSFIVIQFS